MKRSASAVWQGDLKAGTGNMTTDSKALNATPYSFASRFESAPQTNPEELIAAANAGCFAMFASVLLSKAGFTAERLDARADLSFEQVDGNWTITTIALDLTAKVPGLTEGQLQSIAEEAKDGCPVSRALKASHTVKARLA
jgi:osmotically inducible protein OsmC